MSSDSFEEQPLDVSAESGLFGILTRPTIGRSSTAFILLNAGIMHRVGPFRLNVSLARGLARGGFLSVRLDLSGKGDSDKRVNQSSSEALTNDAIEIMRLLKSRFSIDRFVFGGLCSGADNALMIAPAFPEVAGLILLDGYAARTPRYYVTRYLRYLARLASPRAVARRLVGGIRNRARANDLRRVGLRDWETPNEMHARYRNLLGRGTALFCVYTSNARDRYNDERSGPRNLDSGVSEISIVSQAAVPKPVASKYTTSGVRRPSEL